MLIIDRSLAVPCTDYVQARRPDFEASKPRWETLRLILQTREENVFINIMQLSDPHVRN